MKVAIRHNTSTIWLAVGAAIALPLVVLAFAALVARAPDDHTGRILIVFQDQPSDTEAFGRIASAGARPLRVISQIDGWIAEADTSQSVATLRAEFGANYVFRDIGLGRALAGCLSLASGPVRPRGIIP